MVLGIYGSGGGGIEALYTASAINEVDSKWDKIVFIDDFQEADTLYDCEVYSFEELKQKFSPEQIEIIISLGEPKNKKMLWDKVKDCGYRMANLIYPGTRLHESVKIGEGVHICCKVFISYDVVIADNAYISPFAVIGHGCQVHKHSVVSAGTILGGNTVVGESCFIGLNTCIKEELTIGDNTIIAMGSAVFQSLPEKVIAVGNPARISKNNDNMQVFSRK